MCDVLLGAAVVVARQSRSFFCVSSLTILHVRQRYARVFTVQIHQVLNRAVFHREKRS